MVWVMTNPRKDQMLENDGYNLRMSEYSSTDQRKYLKETCPFNTKVSYS